MTITKKLSRLLTDKEISVGAAQKLNNAASAAGRDLTPKEQADFSLHLANVDRLNADIKTEEQRIQEEENRPGVDYVPGELSLGAGDEGWAQPLAREGALGRAKGATFKAMFPTLHRSGAFKSFSDFMAPIHQGTFHPALMAATGMSEGVGSDGGYLVPTEFAARMLDVALEDEVVRPRARIEPMVSNTKMISGFDNTDHTQHLGGFTAQWIGEGAPMTPQKGLIRQFNLKVSKLAILAAASNELLADGAGFDTLIADQLTSALAWNLDDAFLNGDGVGKPLGVFKDPALVVATKETGQSADTLDQFNLARMVSRLHPACFKNSVWVIHPETLEELLTAALPAMNTSGVIVGATGQPILVQSENGLRMHTRPVLISEKLAMLGDQGDILLADFSQYAIGLRPEISIQRSGHVYFESDEIAYRAIVRADGRGTWKGAMTPANGSTLSWAVTLAARA